MDNCAGDFEPFSLAGNKQKYIMMSGLISGPQQSGNDIDTYFRPLVEDLQVLSYNDGVHV
jgi:hypothetical protein